MFSSVNMMPFWKSIKFESDKFYIKVYFSIKTTFDGKMQYFATILSKLCNLHTLAPVPRLGLKGY